jgi:hypothetical protein
VQRQASYQQPKHRLLVSSFSLVWTFRLICWLRLSAYHYRTWKPLLAFFKLLAAASSAPIALLVIAMLLAPKKSNACRFLLALEPWLSKGKKRYLYYLSAPNMGGVRLPA